MGAAAAAEATDPLGRAYAVLGVPATASDAELKAAFTRLAKLHHPDAAAAATAAPDVAKFIQARESYALALRHRRAGADDPANIEAATEEALGRFDIRHTAPQHRQYLEHDGIGAGTPSERLRQRQQWRVHQAAERVRDYRVAKLAGEADQCGGPASPALRPAERRSAKDFRTRSLMDRLVEDLIQESVSRGELQNCRYYGKPLPDRAAASGDPFADSMTHKLNAILASNGYEPDWLLLDKEVRAGAAAVRARLTDARRRLGRWPFADAAGSDAVAWQRAVDACGQAVLDLNRQVDQLNLMVPTLRQQRCHYSLVRLAGPIAEDNSLANSWQQQQQQQAAAAATERASGLVLRQDSGAFADLFSLATLRQAWADLRSAFGRLAG